MQWVSTKEVRISSNNELSQLCNPVQYDTVAFFFWNQPVTVPPPGGGDGHGGGGGKVGLETAVGYEDTAAATARYSLPACHHKGGDSSGIQGTHPAILN